MEGGLHTTFIRKACMLHEFARNSILCVVATHPKHARKASFEGERQARAKAASFGRLEAEAAA